MISSSFYFCLIFINSDIFKNIQQPLLSANVNIEVSLKTKEQNTSITLQMVHGLKQRLMIFQLYYDTKKKYTFRRNGTSQFEL